MPKKAGYGKYTTAKPRKAKTKTKAKAKKRTAKKRPY
jgi:hypothetical protein